MKLSLAIHGGLAAGMRRPVRTVDLDKLPDVAARVVLAALAAARASPGSGAADKARDAMSYVVTVEDGGASTELRRSDVTMTPEFDALVACLEKYAAKA